MFEAQNATELARMIEEAEEKKEQKTLSERSEANSAIWSDADLKQADAKEDIDSFLTEIEKRDKELTALRQKSNGTKSLPPVRNRRDPYATVPVKEKTSTTTKTAPPTSGESKSKTLKYSYDYYDNWDKYDPEQELKQQEEADTQIPKGKSEVVKSRPETHEKYDTHTLSDVEKNFVSKREKEKGNECYKCGEYAQAIAHFTRSLEAKSDDPVLFSNRAQAYLMIKNFTAAEADATSAIKLKSNWSKPYFRRGVARRRMTNYEAALQDFEKAVELDSASADSKRELKEVKTRLDEIRQHEIWKKKKRMEIIEVDDDEDEEEDVPINIPKSVASAPSPSPAPATPPSASASPSPPSPSPSPSPAPAPSSAGSSEKSPVKIPEKTSAAKTAANKYVCRNNVCFPSLLCGDCQDNLEGKKRLSAKFKNEGNEFFRKKNYEEALERYLAALGESENNILVLGNIAQTHICLKQWGDAERVCSETFQILNSSENLDGVAGTDEKLKIETKIFYRRGVARRELGRLDEAAADMKEAIERQRDSTQAKDELEKILKLISERQGVRKKVAVTTVEDDEDSSDEIDEATPSPSPAPASSLSPASAPSPSAAPMPSPSSRTPSSKSETKPKEKFIKSAAAEFSTQNKKRVPIELIDDDEDDEESGDEEFTAVPPPVGYNQNDDDEPREIEPPQKIKTPEKIEPQETEEKIIAKGIEFKNEGNKFFFADNFPAAIEKYSLAIASDPTNPVYLANRALAFYYFGNFEKALEDSSACLRLDPTNIKALYRRSQSLFNLGRTHEALFSVNAALAIFPAHPQMSTLKYQIKISIADQNAKKSPAETAATAVENKNSKIKTIRIVSAEDSPYSKPSVSPTKNLAAEMPSKISVEKIVPDFTTFKAPQSGMEFYSTLRLALKQKTKNPLWSYLLTINTQALPKLFASDADEESVLGIIEAIHDHVSLEHAEKQIEILEAVCSIPRISIVLGYLLSSHKKMITDTLDALLPLGPFADRVSRIRQTFLKIK